MTLNQAVATAMVMQLLPQSAPGVYNYWKDILWIPSLLVVLGSILGIWFGSYIVRQKIVSNRFLYRTITIFLFVSSVYFFITHWNHTDLDIIE